MVIDAPHGDPPIARFWFEEGREGAPWWMPSKGWWTRWRRTGPRKKMVLRGHPNGVVVDFATREELRLMMAYMERCEG